MLIEARLEHSANAPFPIEVMLLGIVIEVRLEHSANASSPIEVTPSGMLIEVRQILY